MKSDPHRPRLSTELESCFAEVDRLSAQSYSLLEDVAEDLESLASAIDEGAIPVYIPAQASPEVAQAKVSLQRRRVETCLERVPGLGTEALKG